MSKLPFKRFVVSLLLFNKSIPFVVEKLKGFGYFSTDDEVSEIFSEVRTILPESIREIVNNGNIFDLSNETHIQWLNHFEVFEIYDYINRCSQNIQDPPPYFKWCADCLWIHEHKDIMCLVNILLYNNESYDCISDIISFKYKKKIGVEALKLYHSIFWTTESVTAKDALKYCIPFRENALILRQFRSGDAEIEKMSIDECDGMELPVVFHDSNYIKWKIGYHDVKIPSVKDFMEEVKKDSFFKYKETMAMTHSAEYEEEDGSNDKLGAFNSTKSYYRNVEENRAKQVQKWLDVFLKADKSIPPEPAKNDDFFDKMAQVELEFDECEESIVRIDDVPNIMEDIKGDLK